MERNATYPARRGTSLMHALLVAGLVLAPVAAHAEDTDLRKLADRLIELRGQVETLNDDIEARQQQHRNRMTSMAQRRAELDGQVQRQELESKKLRRQLAEVRSRAEQIDQASKALRPTALQTTETLQAYVSASLPFTREQRLAEVQDIRKQLEKGDMSTPRALNQLWSFVEDELRLSRGSGIFRQTIPLGGQEQLADVVRIGLVMLFFRTGDGGFGYAQQGAKGWTFTTVSGPDTKLVSELFAAFERQVRSGYFDLPNPLQGEQR